MPSFSPRWAGPSGTPPTPRHLARSIYTNLRPVKIYDALAGASTLRPEVIKGVDLVIVRELTGGLYFGRRERFYDEEGAGANGGRGQRAYDTMEYREYEVERIARKAFEAARKRRNKVTSVDKRNVLETSRLWREVVHRVHDEEFPEVELEDLLVDNTAMQLINRPADFDVIVTENTFGDILSDEAAQITGSLGMLASASLGDGVSLFEPSAGSAPDIAGKGIANPLAQILSAGMMLTYAFDMTEEAGWVESAVERVLDDGWRRWATRSWSTCRDAASSAAVRFSAPEGPLLQLVRTKFALRRHFDAGGYVLAGITYQTFAWARLWRRRARYRSKYVQKSLPGAKFSPGSAF